MFPIVFAAISGRSMKMIARFLAERGSKLSVCTSHHTPTLVMLVVRADVVLDFRTADGESIRLGYD